MTHDTKQMTILLPTSAIYMQQQQKFNKLNTLVEERIRSIPSPNEKQFI